jgi:RNA polymerase sigma-70 factor (ECF subfamily)
VGRKEGERDRFERLYAEHFERVAAYLLARADSEMAADALAGTFEVAWRRLGDVPQEPLPWLLGVARRVLANARRAGGRRAALVERMAAVTLKVGADTAERELSEQLTAAIDELTGAQQEALLLIAWDGLSEREAAQALGCSRGAFAARLHRARARVRAAMGEERGDQLSPHDDRERPGARVPARDSIEEAT